MRFLFLCWVLAHKSFTVGVSATDDVPLSEKDDKSTPSITVAKHTKIVNENKTDRQNYTLATEIKATTVTNFISLEITTERTKRPFVATRRSDVIDVLNVTKISQEPCIFVKIYNYIANAIKKFLNEPRVKSVFNNIGTCVVNGALDIVSFYVPAPLIPLVASVAGMVIPFDPVVSLRERLPVTSYRRAMSTAVKSFLGTFDRYKEQLLDYDEDPFMTRRFNRRLMNDDFNGKTTGRKKKKTTTYDDVDEEEVTTKPKRKNNKNNILDD